MASLPQECSLARLRYYSFPCLQLPCSAGKSPVWTQLYWHRNASASVGCFVFRINKKTLFTFSGATPSTSKLLCQGSGRTFLGLQVCHVQVFHFLALWLFLLSLMRIFPLFLCQVTCSAVVSEMAEEKEG